MDTLRLVLDRAEDTEDGVLDALDDAARARAALEAPMGAASTSHEPQEIDPDRTYDLEVVRPRAVDLRKLWKLAGRPVPADVQAALGASVPVLLHHGMTPFARPGQEAGGVWGMGYQVRIDVPEEVHTISVMPESETTKLGSVDQDVEVGLAFGGEMAVPKPALDALNAVPGVALHGAEVRATTDQRFALSIHLRLCLVKVLAGPIGSGGARWDLYRQEERLDRFQPLLQTLLIPEGTRALILEVTTWIRRRGLLGGRLGSRQWSSQPMSFEVSLAGLEAQRG